MSVVALLKSNRNSLLFLVFLVIMPFFASSLVVWAVIQYEPVIRHFSFLEWTMVYLLASFTMSLALTHTTFIALLSGYFIGWESLGWMVPAYILASLMGYGFARFIDHGSFLGSISELKGVRNVVTNLKKKEALIIFFCRISPVLPFALTNALLSILQARLATYILAGSAGMLPRTLLFLWLGIQARTIQDILQHPGENLVSRLLFLGLLILSVGGLFWIFKRVAAGPADESVSD